MPSFQSLIQLAVVLVGFAAAVPVTIPPEHEFSRRAPGRYIVKVKENAAPLEEVVAQVQAIVDEVPEANLNQVYGDVLKGFAGEFSGAALDFLTSSDDIESIEEDQIVSISVTQTDAPWGIARIDQRAPLGTTNLDVNKQYDYTEPAGDGVLIYIVDTGVRGSHSDFGGRASTVKSFGGYALTDGNGHGTHCAGTAAGTRYGVAKKATIRGVKVLSDSGSGLTSDVIAGINFVASEAAATTAPVVLSMSLGGGLSTSTNTAVTNAVAAGVTVVVAAGNDNANACNYSPASAPSAITVGATTIGDARASFSNFGTCVDVFAPGVSITSTWSTSDSATNTISGTSMACPHVAGLAAYYLSKNPTWTPAQVAAQISNSATSGAISNPGTGSPNKLVYNSFA